MKKWTMFFLSAVLIFSSSISVIYAENVTMYSVDGRTISVSEDSVEAHKAVGWYTEPMVIMYALDGRTCIVKKSEVYSYKLVGWYYGQPVTMYADDGRCIIVGKHEISAYEKVGWHYTVNMYASDGRIEKVPYDNVQAWKYVGWSTEPFVMMYALDGRTLVIPQSETEAYKAVGWYTEDMYNAHYSEKNPALGAEGDSNNLYADDVEEVDIEDIDNTITLSGDLPAGTYTLRYENSSGIMGDYAAICSLEITDSGEDVTYEGFIPQNSAPIGATTIGVYNSSDEKIDELSLGSLSTPDLGEKLYSFAAFSDAHIGETTARATALKNALNYVENSSDIAFTTICGDFVQDGKNISHFETYKGIVDSYTKPIYAVAGNHEANSNNLSADTLQPYTGQDSLWYSFTKGDDVFIMFGLKGCASGSLFSTESLRWLYETLEENRDKRCFVYQHVRPENGCGNACDLYGHDIYGGTEAFVFESLMEHYQNVTLFHGHSHLDLKLQEFDKLANYDNIFGSHSVHIPSIGKLKGRDLSGSLMHISNGSQGYIVDVYENAIVLKGRDFISGKFLPIAQYLLDTKTKNIEANTYYDSTGTVVNSNSNILKSGSSWYEGSADKSTITKISFVDNYSASVYDESWDASISENNQVMAYRTGTEVTIAGNKNGIVANSNSSGLFKGFSGLTQIEGLDNINTSNIIQFQAAFSGCSGLTSIDLSSWDLSKVGKFNGLFYNCSALTSVKLPDNIGEKYSAGNLVNLSQMFENCTSLEVIDLSNLPSPTGRNYYMSGTFKDCYALRCVKLGEYKVSTMVNTFYRNAVLEEIDMSKVDFSQCDSMLNAFRGCSSLHHLKLPAEINTAKVKDFSATFYGCKSLALDCSAWDTTSCTKIADFNFNALEVIAPLSK